MQRDEQLLLELESNRKAEEEMSVFTENPNQELDSDSSIPLIDTVNKSDSEVVTPAKEEEVAVEELSVKEKAESATQEEVDVKESRESLIDLQTMPGYKPRETKEEDDEAQLKSDLERLKAAQEWEGGEEEEGAPSVDEDIETFKKVLYAEQVPITEELTQYADMPSEVRLPKAGEGGDLEKKASLFTDQEQASIVGLQFKSLNF